MSAEWRVVRDPESGREAKVLFREIAQFFQEGYVLKEAVRGVWIDNGSVVDPDSLERIERAYSTR